MIFVFESVLIFVFTLLLLGCVPSLSKTATSAEKTKSETVGSTLIKPKIVRSAENENVNAPTNPRNKDNQVASSLDTTSDSPIHTKIKEIDEKDQNLSPKTLKESPDKDIAPRRLLGKERGKLPAASEQMRGDDPTDVKIAEPREDQWKEPEAKVPSFKKHDHQEYVTRIKNLAIDKVNKESDSFYARICNDSTTDDWILTIYFKHNKTFSYKSLVWDSIDGKWDSEYESDKRPMNIWKKHLAFASSGKKCTALKGSVNNQDF